MLEISFETTPNPRSRKVILSEPAHHGDAIVYRTHTGAFDGGRMIEHLLAIEHVTELLLRGNVITITQDGKGSWYLLEDQINHAIASTYQDHDPEYAPPPIKEESDEIINKPPVVPSAQLDIIREILDETITPYIDSHGGSLELIEFNTETHQLTIFYQGACSTCPSSFGMTLSAVQNLLRDQYDPVIRVTIANPAEDLAF